MTDTTLSKTINYGVVPGFFARDFGTNISITGSGAIYGVTYGIYGTSDFGIATIFNAGHVNATDLSVILHDSADYINNSGVISGGEVGVFLTPGRLTNSGQILGGTFGIFANYSSTADLLQGGRVYSDNLGLYCENSAISNSGSIGGGSFGVVLPSGFFDNTATGIVSGKQAGVLQQNGVIHNSGAISGFASGAGLGGAGTFDNYGTIAGFVNGFSLIGSQSSALLVNSGQISGFSNGVRLVKGEIVNGGTFLGGKTGATVYSGSLFNWNEIKGSTIGVSLVSGYVFNAKNITGSLCSVYEAAGTFANGGNVSSGTIGVVIGSGTLINNGTISGGRYAVEGFGAFELALSSTSRLNGNVVDHYNNGLLVLQGSVAGTLAGLGSSIDGFSTIDISPGAKWTLEGNAAGLANGQAINGFAAGDTLIIDRFSAATDTVSEAGITLNGASGELTLGMPNSSQPQYFTVTSTYGNTTITAAPLTSLSVIATNFSHRVALGNGYFSSYFTITSTGSVIEPGSEAAYLDANADSLTNAGSLDGQYTGVDIAAGTLINSGIIDGRYLDGINVTEGLAVNTGTISGPDYGANLGWGTIVNSGLISGYYGINDIANGIATVVNAGTISGSKDAIRAFSGLDLIVDPRGVFDGTVDLTGTLRLAGTTAGSLDMGGSFTGVFGVVFDPGSHWFIDGQISDFSHAQNISGFALQDTIQIDGFTVASDTFISGTGLILSDGAESMTLDFQGSLSTADFTVTNDASGVAITSEAVPCFCPGTRIASMRGNVAVESLKIGDLVKTAAHGLQPIRWIGQRAYDGRFIAGNHLALPVKIRRHALGFNVPSRDLYVSPGHAICEGGVLVHAWRLVNGVSITQAQSVERVDYFHVELDRHAVIFAENTPVETYLDDGSRVQFHNAASAPEMDRQAPCLPIIEEGYYLARLQARINARAGLAPPATPGPLRGNIDRTEPRLFGWAQDEAAPECAVELELLCAGQPVLRVMANRYRPDLRAAGLGSGCHAFELDMPNLPGPFTLRRVADGLLLGAGHSWMATRRAG